MDEKIGTSQGCRVFSLMGGNKTRQSQCTDEYMHMPRCRENAGFVDYGSLLMEDEMDRSDLIIGRVGEWVFWERYRSDAWINFTVTKAVVTEKLEKRRFSLSWNMIEYRFAGNNCRKDFIARHGEAEIQKIIHAIKNAINAATHLALEEKCDDNDLGI